MLNCFGVITPTAGMWENVMGSAVTVALTLSSERHSLSEATFRVLTTQMPLIFYKSDVSQYFNPALSGLSRTPSPGGEPPPPPHPPDYVGN